MARFGDKGVFVAVKEALKDDGRLSYGEVQDIICSTFDNEVITVQERDDLRLVAKMSKTMDPRARRALEQFLKHIDKASRGVDQQAAKTGNKQLGIPVPKVDPGRFVRYDTDLGKFSHGNFDVAYDPHEGELVVTLKVKYEFESDISAQARTDVKKRLIQAVKAWDNSGAYFRTPDLVLNPIILMRFNLLSVQNGEHFTVDVEKENRREWVGYDLNVWEGTSAHTFVHELGHVFGNYDEYRDGGFMGWLESCMYWHDNRYVKDRIALMNGGSEFRARYFDHFERYVNHEFRSIGATFQTYILGSKHP